MKEIFAKPNTKIGPNEVRFSVNYILFERKSNTNDKITNSRWDLRQVSLPVTVSFSEGPCRCFIWYGSSLYGT